MIEELFKKLLAPKPTSNMSGFQFSDLLNNDRWRTAQRDSYSPKRGELAVEGDPFSGVDYRQYVPRASGGAVVSPTPDGWVHGQGISDPGSPRVTYDSDWSGADRRHLERNQGTTVKRTTDNNGGVTTTETTKFLPYERLADINKSGFTPARFMPSTYAEEGPAMASYAPPTMRNQFAEEGPGMGSYAPWSDRAGARPPMERGPVRTTGTPFGHAIRPERGVYHDEMQGATPYYPMQNSPEYFGPQGQLRHNMGTVGATGSPLDRRTSATTYPYNTVPQADVGLIPISTQNTPQPQSVTPLQYSNQSQMNRLPAGDLGLTYPAAGNMFEPTMDLNMRTDLMKELIKHLIRRSD